MKLKLNTQLKDFKIGQIIIIPDIDGVPKDAYWRNRLKDAAIDKCVEIVTNEIKVVAGVKMEFPVNVPKTIVTKQENAVSKHKNKKSRG